MGSGVSTTSFVADEAAKPVNCEDVCSSSSTSSLGTMRAEVVRLRTALRRHALPIDSLGPFHLVRLRASHLQMVTHQKPSRVVSVGFEIAGPPGLVALCRRYDFPMEGRISSIQPVSFTAAQLEHAGISPHAAYVGFSYPAQVRTSDGVVVASAATHDSAADWNELEDCRKSFLRRGGFVYFDQALKVLHVNALVQADAVAEREGLLQFDGPYMLPLATLDVLQRNGRFEEVTLSALREIGAESFCWVGPGDPIAAALTPPALDGAFCYKFAESYRSCYFRVSQRAQTHDLSSLGPFSLVRVHSKRLVVQLGDHFEAVRRGAGVEYKVVGPKAMLGVCASLNMGCTGTLSRCTPITLSPERLEKVGIHRRAAFFSFCYPLNRAIEVTPSEMTLADIDPSYPPVAFLLYGGFIYFDKNGKALHLNALRTIEAEKVNAELTPLQRRKRGVKQLTVQTGNNGSSTDQAGLLFDGPFHLPDVVVEKLDSLGQMNTLTVSEFRMAGATSFCWVGPNDLPPGLTLEKSIPYGAFLYRFGEITVGSAMATPRTKERSRRQSLSVYQREKEDIAVKQKRIADFESQLVDISTVGKLKVVAANKLKTARKSLTVNTTQKLRHRYFPVKDPDASSMMELGPFELTYLSPTWLTVDVAYANGEEADGEYMITGPSILTHYINEAGSVFEGNIIGALSPPMSVTLDEESRRRVNIHPEARYFAFAYPVAPAAALDTMSPDQVAELDPSDPRVAFMFAGGFVYLDEDYEPLHITALAQGPGLFFEGPFHLPATFASRLAREKKLHNVTLFEMHQRGAMSFCWLPPDGAHQSMPGVPMPHGAFAYVFRNPEVRWLLVAGRTFCFCVLPLLYAPIHLILSPLVGVQFNCLFRVAEPPAAAVLPTEDLKTRWQEFTPRAERKGNQESWLVEASSGSSDGEEFE